MTEVDEQALPTLTPPPLRPDAGMRERAAAFAEWWGHGAQGNDQFIDALAAQFLAVAAPVAETAEQIAASYAHTPTDRRGLRWEINAAFTAAHARGEVSMREKAAEWHDAQADGNRSAHARICDVHEKSAAAIRALPTGGASDAET